MAHVNKTTAFNSAPSLRINIIISTPRETLLMDDQLFFLIIFSYLWSGHSVIAFLPYAEDTAVTKNFYFCGACISLEKPYDKERNKCIYNI